MKDYYFYKTFVVLLFLFFSKCLSTYCLASDTVYAENSVSIIGSKPLCGSCKTVFNLSNSESDNGAYTELISSAGYAVGLGSYKSQIELRFESTVAANTTTYIRIDGEDNLFQSLLGGSLGDLLSDVLGSVLFGQQEIIIDARTASGSVLSRSSIAGFDTDQVRLVSDESGNYYIAIRPNSPYDRIRITNQASSIAGLNTEYSLEVYHAFYYKDDPCGGQPVFTSYDGSGITLEALELNNAVESLNLAIDSDLDNTFSEISLGVVGVAGTIEQMIYFNSPVMPGNEILISMATGSSLLDLGLLNYVELVAYSNGAEVSTTSAASLLELDVLGLLASDEFFKFPISDDDSAIDQIGIRVSSLVGVGLLEGSLMISGVTVAPIRPEITDIPEEGAYVICFGETVTVTPNNSAGSDLNWYRMESSSEVSMGTAASYTTPDDLPPGDYEFLVKSNNSSCAVESEPSRFKVTVNPIPTPANYSILPSGEVEIDEDGKYIYVEGMHPVTLNPDLLGWAEEGQFEWYLDETMVVRLQDGDVISDVLYELEDGNLTMTGLKFRDESDPYKLYLHWVPEEGCGANEVKELDLSSIARILNVSLQNFDAHRTLDDDVNVSWRATIDRSDLNLVLQRAGSDLVFKDIWEGELATYTDFDFLDTEALVGESYYRLEVRNQQGESKFISDLRRIYIPVTKHDSFQVYPNEFESYFTIGSCFDQSKDISYALYSSEGSLLKAGTSQIALQNPVRIVGMESHAPGKYLLVIKEKDKAYTHHLIKR